MTIEYKTPEQIEKEAKKLYEDLKTDEIGKFFHWDMEELIEHCSRPIYHYTLEELKVQLDELEKLFGPLDD